VRTVGSRWCRCVVDYGGNGFAQDGWAAYIARAGVPRRGGAGERHGSVAHAVHVMEVWGSLKCALIWLCVLRLLL